MTQLTHEQLASIWLQFNGSKATTKQIDKTIKQLSFESLIYMLKQRNLI